MSTSQTASTFALPKLTSGRTIRLGIRRIAFELRQYFRAGDQVFFTFLFPTVMYAIFAAAFSNLGDIGTAPDGSGGVDMPTFYLPGLIAGGILLSGVQNLATDIAVEKSDGTLKRLGGSPLSPVSYFLGKLGQVFVTSILQIGLLMLVAVVAFGVQLPMEADRWGTFVWVYLLGITGSALLGVALSAVPRSGKSAAAVVIPIVLVLQFISGVYLQFSMLPSWLQTVASFFPVKWVAQGMRSVFLPDSFQALEPNGAWELGLVALVLTGWIVVGAILARLTFRWIHKDS